MTPLPLKREPAAAIGRSIRDAMLRAVRGMGVRRQSRGHSRLRWSFQWVLMRFHLPVPRYRALLEFAIGDAHAPRREVSDGLGGSARVREWMARPGRPWQQWIFSLPTVES